MLYELACIKIERVIEAIKKIVPDDVETASPVGASKSTDERLNYFPAQIKARAALGANKENTPMILWTKTSGRTWRVRTALDEELGSEEEQQSGGAESEELSPPKDGRSKKIKQRIRVQRERERERDVQNHRKPEDQATAEGCMSPTKSHLMVKVHCVRRKMVKSRSRHVEDRRIVLCATMQLRNLCSITKLSRDKFYSAYTVHRRARFDEELADSKSRNPAVSKDERGLYRMSFSLSVPENTSFTAGKALTLRAYSRGQLQGYLPILCDTIKVILKEDTQASVLNSEAMTQDETEKLASEFTGEESSLIPTPPTSSEAMGLCDESKIVNVRLS
ncbi:hypothetical protein SISSUDRAFT_1038536 [Sistotremastrum suecicum HHB10207 ss-3]|uniref:Uncharacterized protein n=1 Tax=Sistotremastrum suecicum HHB10207 ss-3 TaxID=1314776 RepID=A0A165WLJ5_9AGAM|nr:hypothetical protein SISSUDRAFT_1038536 [Sistotremastrum suecicum HHB10207 ss-3]